MKSVQKENNWSTLFKLRPFYRLNSCVPTIGEKYEIVPSYFNKEFRILNYAYIPRKWVFNSGEAYKVVEERRQKLEEIFREIENNKNNLSLSDSIIKKLQDEEIPMQTEVWLECYFDLRAPATWNEEGIAYRMLSDHEGSKGKITEVFNMQGGCFENQGPPKGRRWVQWQDKEFTEKDRYLDNYIDNSIGEEIHSSLFKVFMREDVDFNKYWEWPCLVFPIFDVYIYGKGYGGVRGFFTVFFKDDSGEKKQLCQEEIEEITNSITPILSDMSHQLLESEFWRVSEKELKHLNIIEHFLMIITYIQDWENIWITKKSSEEIAKEKINENDIVSCWVRSTEPLQKKWVKSKETKLCYLQELCKEKNRFFGWNLKELDIFSSHLKEDNSRNILNYHIICEYPKAYILPNEQDRLQQVFEDQLKIQQLRVFEIVINKWRRYRAAEQLAASAIMSRNMSHNIGSHVLAKVVASDDEDLDKFKNLKDELDREDKADIEILNEFLNKVSKRQYKKMPKLLKKATLNRSKNLFSYLQGRMDHLAAVATDHVKSTSRSMPFSFGYLINEFDKQKLIRQYITGVDINVKVKGGILQQENEELVFTEKEIEKGIEEIYANIPNGGTGMHAFYIILENYIRNVVKHKLYKGLPKKLTIYVAIEDKIESHEDMFRIWLWDNIVRESNNEVRNAAKKISACIDEAIIDKNFQPRQEGWGIVEMKQSAKYLRKDTYADLVPLEVCVKNKNKDENNGYYLTDGKVKVNKENEGLCPVHIFYMEKPKEVLIVDPEKSVDIFKDTTTTLRGHGIKIVHDINEIYRKENKGYQRLVFLSEVEDKDMEKRWQWPLQTYSVKNSNCSMASVDGDDLVAELKDNKLNAYKIFCYLDQMWFKFLCIRHRYEDILPLCHSNSSALGVSCRKTLEENLNNLILYRSHDVKEKNTAEKLIKKCVFIEIYGSLSPQTSIYQRSSWENDEQKESSEFQFRSAGLTTVVILDERIQKTVKKFRESIKESEIDRKRVVAEGLNRVYVPKRCETDLEHPTWKGITEYITKVQKNKNNENNENNENVVIDHIVIHLTILEKLVGTQEDNIEERIKELLGETGDSIYTNKPKPLSVLICTGRGKSISDVKFIPISELEKWICSTQSSKYHLCQCLNN